MLARQKRPSGRPKGMAAAREEGLAQALPEDNKGYQLLKKMGFREGQAIGELGCAAPGGGGAWQSGLGVCIWPSVLTRPQGACLGGMVMVQGVCMELIGDTYHPQ